MRLYFLGAAFALHVVCGCGGTVESTGTGGGSGQTTGSGGANTGSSSSSAGTTTTTTTTGGNVCAPACGPGFTCCAGQCVNTGNDIKNCAACGTVCQGDPPFCAGNTCADPPCSGTITCQGATFCCGAVCCEAGMLCCDVPGPGPSAGPKCTAPENGTCPVGCPSCD